MTIAHPYDFDTIEFTGDALGRIWRTNSIETLVAAVAYAKEGDRAYVLESGLWLTRKLVVLRDATTTTRWVPDDPRFGRNDIPAGFGYVPAGTVSLEGVWGVSASIGLTEAQLNTSYDVLMLSVDTSGGSKIIGSPSIPASFPNFLRIACAKLVKGNDGNILLIHCDSNGYPGGDGGTGAGGAGAAATRSRGARAARVEAWRASRARCGDSRRATTTSRRHRAETRAAAPMRSRSRSRSTRCATRGLAACSRSGSVEEAVGPEAAGRLAAAVGSEAGRSSSTRGSSTRRAGRSSYRPAAGQG